MTVSHFAAPGGIATDTQFRTDQGRQFARFLKDAGPETFTELLELRRAEAPAGDVVVFETQSGRPQRCIHPIKLKERLAAFFPDNQSRPQVFALRADFPQVPHLYLEEEEFPRSLCLYDRTHEVIRLTWTPASFLERVRFWLKNTARGILHADDQPLEPLIEQSDVHFVFPPGILAENASKTLEVLNEVRSGTTRTIISTWAAEDRATVTRRANIQVVVFNTPLQLHGIIRRAPKNLADLDELMQAAGVALVRTLVEKLTTWHLAGVLKEVGKRELLLVLVLPKRREKDASKLATEYRALLSGNTIHNIAHLLGVLSIKPGRPRKDLNLSKGALEKIPLQVCQTHCSLLPSSAATLNGVPYETPRIAAFGAGALGSQVIVNLIRAGWGEWYSIDPDVFFPHNIARHTLDGYAVGHYKVGGLQIVCSSFFPEKQILTGIADDVLHSNNPQTQKAIRQSDFIVDFSASLPVSRFIALNRDLPRAFSAFTSPRGESFVLLGESRNRAIRLDWLEMLHYRAVLNDELLKDTLTVKEGRYRYGDGCRDVSAIIAHEDLALWSATCARSLRELVKGDDAFARIYYRLNDGRVELRQPEVSPPVSVRLIDGRTNVEWTVSLDAWLLRKLSKIRASRLPNETGGILLGVFDTAAKVCWIVDILPSPPDSTEWPWTYIRGCEGLLDEVRSVQRRTSEQVTYVGEWHSHPNGCSTRPSNDDMEAYRWLVGHMRLEALPALMFIIGEGDQFTLVGAA